MSTESPVRDRSPRRVRESASIPNSRDYKCYAIGVGYSGDGYCGIQIQAGDIPTIERDLQAALVACKLIDPLMLKDAEGRNLLFWSRAARTDRGVHACVNVVACRLNSTLIREISGEGPLKLDQESFLQLVNPHLPENAIRCLFINRVTMRFDARVHCDRRTYEYYLPKHVGGGHVLDVDAIRAAMVQYEGTHNFHNFTKGVHANDKNGVRHIVSVVVDDPSGEVIRIRICGQSFLMNQIRKMIGLAVEVSLALCPPDSISHALTSKELVHIHMVPGEGLLLDTLSFRAYDLHKCGDYQVTTPFNWLLADEESDGDSGVMQRVSEFKGVLVAKTVLPKVKEAFPDWISLVLVGNPWDVRHSAPVTSEKEPLEQE